MNYAVIDLGSNSIRLSVYSCENDEIEKIISKKEIVSLARYVSNGVLALAGIQAASELLNYFKMIALKFAEPSNIYLFATASLRNIDNRDEAIKIIIEETSLIPDVLEGEEEAALGFAGASQFMNCENGIMIDIGGASTELVLFKDYRAVSLVSLPIGCLNLSVRYIEEIIPTHKERKRIKEAIRKQLSQIDWEEDTACPLMVGVGGTLRAALRLSCVLFDLPSDQNSIQSHHVKDIIKRLLSNDDSIDIAIYKTIPERVLSITAGLTILQQVINQFGCETILISKYGVREGYLIDRVLKTDTKNDIAE